VTLPLLRTSLYPSRLLLIRLTLLTLLTLSLSAPSLAAAAPPDNAMTSPPIGGLDIGVAYWTTPDQAHDGLMARATAMAVDRVRGTVVGRFGELRGSIGFDFQGDLLPYEFAFKLGVGVATDYFTLFIATGILSDAYEALSDEVSAMAIPSAVGMPMTLGFWLTPASNLYIYAMAEPAWYFGVEQRQTTVKPVNIGEEMRARLGLGWEIDNLHIRADYTYHQVSPHPLHLFTLGFGPPVHLPAF
jgi:hypothetical protein